MNISWFLLVISTLLLCLIKPSFAEEAVPPGVSFVSPNGRYCVQVEGIGGLPRFVIKDIETGRIDDSIISTGPVYLHWAANSKSFVAVEHIARGSCGRLIYLAGDSWSDVKVEPPSEGKMDAKIIDLKLGTDSVHYKFAVTKLAPDWTPIGYWFCELDVSLGTGKVSNVKWTPISQEDEREALEHDPVYLPPMERERYYHVCR